MVEVNFENKQLNDWNKSIESMICNDCGLKPVTYFVVRWTKRNPDYEYVYICKACKEKFNRQSVFGFDPQGIIEAINIRLAKQGVFKYA